MQSTEQQLRSLMERIRALSDEAWRIVSQKEESGKAATPYWNIPALLGDAERACRSALSMEQEGAHV